MRFRLPRCWPARPGASATGGGRAGLKHGWRRLPTRTTGIAASVAGTGRVGSGLHAARRTKHYLAKPHLYAPLHRELEGAGLRPVLRRATCTRAHGSRPGPGGSYQGDVRADHGMRAVAGGTDQVPRIARGVRVSSNHGLRGSLTVSSTGSACSEISELKQAPYRPLDDGNVKDCLNRAMLGGVNHCGLGQFYLE